MDSAKPTPEQPAMPGFGVARDLRHLKTHSAASVAELGEFLAQTRGRRPQEVLGLVAGSQLMRSVAVATVGSVVVLVVCTVVPWWLNQLSADSAAVKPTEPPKTAATTVATPEAKRSEQPPADSPAPAADATPSQVDAEQAIKVMGLDDTKAADPKKNPLENSLDNLLDKIE